ncbi:hypothetical protein HMPREF1531_01227 [Propionibacterium sp. oral taxon 192 str. F0372]|uniref:response regulator transcription factor n=1 Tax=Propionibacterium sp. oral taxon 192 TaxID=671222 RepID=UPI000353FB92|nr:response regulator transcription factor [Propionibacterium sp. oral taxon 192]EPH03801.1 hypothetical protein HMPREF1531_01227 [Propionibacterium sp. oral taxon 192 str. F0372]
MNDTNAARPRLVVADDSALLREGLVGLLQRQGFDIVATESRADAVRQTVTAMIESGDAPDCLLTDVRMPPTMSNDGLVTALDLKTAHPRLSVMVLSQYVAPVYAQQLFALPNPVESGGSGYLLKDRVSQVVDFIDSLRLVISGGVVIDPEVARAMMMTSRSGLGELTRRELEVLELMARGESNSQIAGRLVLSSAAVAKHVSNIFAKLGLAPDEENRRVRAILAFLSQSN